MKNKLRDLLAPGTTLRQSANNIIYSKLSRSLVRKLDTHNNPFIKQIPEGLRERVKSEALSENKQYANLTILNWQEYLDQDFELLLDGKSVYGNRIERPQNGYALEYRNIALPEVAPQRLTTTLPLVFDVHYSKGAHNTLEQRDFDKKYEVRQRGNLFYSLRGNLNAAKKLIVTFPGFGPSASRISYAVSFNKSISDADLQNAVMLCFQDRYGASGTYMTVSNNHDPLIPEVQKEIKRIAQKLHIADEDILLFGASKGGSIALLAAEQFPKATIVAVVPQLNLPYYFTKPFFINNLFRYPHFHSMTQPGTLLGRYIAEGRNIHYLYSSDDELSNCSYGEFLQPTKTFTKYRFSCSHGKVANVGLPLINFLFKSFLTESKENQLPSVRVKTATDGSRTYMELVCSQYTHEAEMLSLAKISTADGDYYQQLTANRNFARAYYTAEAQFFDSKIDKPGEVSLVTVTGAGVRSTSASQKATFAIGDLDPVFTPTLLTSATVGSFDYALQDKLELSKFKVSVAPAKNTPSKVRVLITDSLETKAPTNFLADDALTVTVAHPELSVLASAIGRRIAAANNLTELEFWVSHPDVTGEYIQDLKNCDWLNPKVKVVSSDS